MRYLFVVQGEGRGHFTQAISLKNMLERNGHEVVAVMVGCSKNREVPEFFRKKISQEVISFQSPNFAPSQNPRCSSILLSILYNLLMLPVFIQSILSIRRTIKDEQPDVVVNFYELMCGLTYGIFSPGAPMVNIAHQYYLMTDRFEYTGENTLRFRLLNFYSWCTSLRSSKILALSFREEAQPKDGKLAFVPPLLRDEVLRSVPQRGAHILGYVLNAAFADELECWSASNLEHPLHFFWDKKGAEEVEMLTPMLAMHRLDDRMFLHYMASCKAYATTGGFESVCEAMYLQKPVLMVPVHIEQECNVIDAMRSGAGVTASVFDLNKLVDSIPVYRQTPAFRQWVMKAEKVILHELTGFEYRLVGEWVMA